MSPQSPVLAGAHPFDPPAVTHSYLERAARSLREAITTSEVPLRYAHAHVAALRATAALLAARATPAAGSKRSRSPQKNAWVLLAEVAPELSEWAAFFAAGAAKRAAAEAGSRHAVTEREADDLVRDADRFLALIEQSLGLTKHVPFQEHLLTDTHPCHLGRSSGKAEERRRGEATSSQEDVPACHPGRSSGKAEERRRGEATSSEENAAGGRPGWHGRVA